MQRVAPNANAQFSYGQLMERLESSIEQMIQIEMSALPACWSERDKREMAEYRLGLRTKESLS